MSRERESEAREVLARAFIDAGQASCGRYIAQGGELTPDQGIWIAAMLALADSRAFTDLEAVREAAARVADEDSLTLANDAKIWHSEKMHMAGDASEHQSRAGIRIAAAIRSMTIDIKGEKG